MQHEKTKKSRYEAVRIISARALQISQGAPVLIKAPKDAPPLEIARMEWEQGLIPIEARRKA